MQPQHQRRQERELGEIGFQVTALGPMRSAAGFLWELQASDLPLKIEQLQLASARAGEDQISLQLRVSTIYVASVRKSGETNSERSGTEQEGGR